jgi:hypothetical protein
MRWSGAAAAVAEAAATAAAAAVAVARSADPSEKEKEKHYQAEKSVALPLEWDARDPLQRNDAANINARTDRRCGVLTRGCLAVPLVQHSSSVDGGDNDSTPENDELSTDCVGVLELVNSQRPRESFTAKDKALASLLAQEVYDTLEHMTMYMFAYSVLILVVEGTCVAVHLRSLLHFDNVVDEEGKED